MKPKIGTKVYCVYSDGILVDNVAFIGNESFIVESLCEATYEDSWEWNYEDFGTEWFTDLAKAKKELYSRFKEEYGDSLVITKITDNWYQIFEEDE